LLPAPPALLLLAPPPAALLPAPPPAALLPAPPALLLPAPPLLAFLTLLAFDCTSFEPSSLPSLSDIVITAED